MFATPFIAGFECSSHRRRDGQRLDLVAATQHDIHALNDYRLLKSWGIRTVREGLRWHLIEVQPGCYDWSSLTTMRQAATAAGTQVIWDLLHYGWPDWVDPWSDSFVTHFARFAREVARRVGPGGDYIPINEISFLAWGGGDVGYLNPFGVGRGDEFKRRLCQAAIAASHAIRARDPRARLIAAEPLIHVAPSDAGNEAAVDAAWLNQVQYEAVDILLGRSQPELGGHEGLLDAVGLNYYPHNQFTTARAMLAFDDPRRRPLHEMLVAAAAQTGKPLFVAETGCEGDARAAWLRDVAQQVRAANRHGAGVGGLCLYPILNHLGWDNDRYCENGLFCGLAGPQRPVHYPLAWELRRQQQRGLGQGAPRRNRPRLALSEGEAFGYA